MVRTTNVRQHDRTLSSGKTITVGKKSGFSRKIPFDLKKYEPLSDKWADEFIKKRHHEKHPDTLNTSRIVFIHPNKLWAEDPARYDVLYLDCEDIPKYKVVPKEAFPNQIIKVKGKFYVGNNDGVFQRGFPPNLKKAIEKGIVN